MPAIVNWPLRAGLERQWGGRGNRREAWCAVSRQPTVAGGGSGKREPAAAVRRTRGLAGEGFIGKDGW